MCIIETVVV